MIEFREATHEYFSDGKKLISVTQLMRKQGLAPDYSGVSNEVLQAKAKRGTLVHKEIEDFIKNDEIGFTKEMLEFKNYIQNNGVEVLQSETILFNDIVAGTCDLILHHNGELIIADIKTTSQLHFESVSWQLSIYAYLNGTKMDKGQAYHFNKDGELTVVDIQLKPMEEVERLMECERKGEIFKQELAINDVSVQALAEAEKIIKYFEEKKKEAEVKAAQMREALLIAMENQGVKSFENENIKITYVAPSTRKSIDSTRLRNEMPEIAKQFEKVSKVNASLRITLKEKK